MITGLFRLETAADTMAKDHDEIPLEKAKRAKEIQLFMDTLALAKDYISIDR